MKEIEHKLTIEQLLAVFEGKKLVLDYHGLPRVTLYPPNYGVFLPYDEYKLLMQILGTRALTEEEKAKLSFINPSPAIKEISS